MDRPPGSPELMLLEDFGQRVDLTRRIREVLVNYPEGTTVLKELIQNADDAGATTVRLCLDRRSHGTDSLLSDRLAQWQGPALLAYNDAVFTEDDFASISRIGDSKKHGQASKTGRFGVGFNSVYHLTDLPSFVSDKYIVIFDPQGAYLPKISAANPGKRIEFVSSLAISLYSNQFAPYCAFGCDMKSPFPGTLFRFPLRRADQAAASKLSRQAYLEDDISFMFSQLYKEAVFTMLFLKSITSVEMYVWEADAYEPHKIYSCSVNSPTENIAWHRQALLRFSASVDPFNWQLDSFSLNFLSENFFGTNTEKRNDTFFIVQGMAPGSSKAGTFATTAVKEYDLHLLPWASVAACVSDCMHEDSFLKQGQAFCFLPLPVKTGLTVQVNAYFELSTNRRSIWFGADMDRGGKLRSDWNTILLEDVVAPIYKELLLRVRKLLGPTKQYYSLWPSGPFEEPWNILVEQMYNAIYLSPVLHTDCENGKWISPLEAFIHDVEFLKSTDLGEALVWLGMPLVHLPKVIVGMLFKYRKNYCHRVVSPMIVRNFLKQCETLVSLSRFYKLVLLEYCLSDLDDNYDDGCANGLTLLPLASGRFGLFSGASQGISYFICGELEYKLLRVVPDKIIDRTISPGLFNKLSEIASGFKTNIGFLDGPSFLQIFPSFFPAEWKYKNRVRWDPELGTTSPTEAWFVLFWQYLRDKTYDLSIFSDWPILPSTSGHLYRASESSKLVNAEMLSNTMKDLLANIGCKLLIPQYGVDHRDLSLYVYDGNADGVVDSIFETAASYNNQLHMLLQDISIDEKNELRQFLLDPKWYYGSSLSDLHKERCKMLPIYKVYSGEYTHTFQYSDLATAIKYLPPGGVSDHLLSCEFINCTHVEEEILVRFYGLERMKRTIFYKENILNKLGELQPDDRDAVMLSILHDLPQLSLDDSSFKESVSTLKFVPTINGNLKSPTSLYDPRVEELHALLEDSDCFPCGFFQEPGVLDMLLLLGLRTRVSAETIIESARQVELFMQKDQLKASSRGKVLLSYLEVNAIKWLYKAQNGAQRKMNMMFSKVSTVLGPSDMPLEADLEKFWSELRMISWCPVLVTAPHPSLPWPSVSSTVAPPKLVRLKADMWLVSASTRILDGECSSSLSFCLGWSSPPGGSVIAAQLLELGKNNEIVTDQALRQELTLAMPKIYALLTNLIGLDEIDIVKVILEGCRWIWVGDGFATVNEVVLNGQLHLAPYIRVIPVDLAAFRELFLQLGIQEFLKPIDYVNILCRMATRKGCIPLDGQELRAAIMIVQNLSEIQFQEIQIQIYLPDISSRLFPATELVFNDAPWLLDFGENTYRDTSTVALNSKRNVHKFVHGNISHDVAEKLGVRSLRRLLLAESSDSMNLSLSGVAEAFGQHEALTTRLKHIVEMYADGPGILFELVQNAEDAQASEVIFLLDKTQYGTSSVLSPEMVEWQGPALYCFNNSIFSSHDLYAISRIGQDSKLEKPLAIGRFGLGFNCVYHFTDIPGFVSGENIVIFDPHACYLPGISATHPGLRIRFVGRKILEQFPDQFTPFLHFGCDLQQSFPGTLFRFPLRSESAATRSQIKKEKYAPEDVELLFSSFSEVVSEALLFLRNVKKITIFVKDGADHEMKLVHRVSRPAVSGIEKELHPLHSMINYIHGTQQSGMDRDQFMKNLGNTIDRDLPWSCQKVVVLEENPSCYMSHYWMLSECIGGGRAKIKSIVLDNRSHNFVPWACVAAYLHSVKLEDVKEVSDILNKGGEFHDCVDARHRKDFEGRAFCFLPLPVCTALPAHVNAYFELSSNRRDIWFGNDMAGGGRARSEWNTFLLEDVIAPAYGHLLAAIAEEVGPCDLFFSFWPTAIGHEPWASVVRKLYVSIADLGLPVLYTKARGGQWISTRQAIFPDFTFPKAVALAEALSEAGLPMVTISRPIVDRFMDVCPALHFLNPQLLRTLLIRRKRGFKSKDAMIITLEYCLSDLSDSAFCENLHGLPLVPLANGIFTMLKARGEGERVFVTSQKEYDLLKDSVPHLLVDCSIPDEVFKKLQDIGHSGKSNLYLLTCDFLVELFPRILPTEWQNSKQVSWSPGHLGQPTLEWMGLLWSYLKVSCSDLSIFSKWPILPVENGCLLKLSRNSNVIKDDGWSENMSSLLHKLGCSFLRSDLPVDHPLLKNYVQDGTASGILNAVQAVASQLQDIKGLFVNASNGEMHELRSFLFQSKWFSGDQINSRHIDTIKLLPMFESYRSRELVNLASPIKWLKPEGIHEDLLDENFIRAESDGEKNILRRYLGVKEPSKVEFYQDYVLNHMSRYLTDPSILSTILLDLKVLIEEDTYMKTALSETPLVLAANGSWQHPSRLYDPRVPGLQKLLHKDVFFPSDKFLNDEILEILVSLGLKKTIGFTGLLDSARSVSMLHDSGDMSALSYGRRLFVCLNFLGYKLSDSNSEGRNHETVDLVTQSDGSYDENLQIETRKEWCGEYDQDLLPLMSSFIHDKSEDEFWSEIKTISWCPVYVTPPLQGLPWFTSDDFVAPPSITRSTTQMWLVSSQMRILDSDCCSSHLEHKLGWVNPPNIRVLSTQLVELAKSYNQLKSHQPEQEPLFCAALEKEIPSLYSRLQGFVGSEDFKILKESVEKFPSVWVGDNFVFPKALAFDSPVKYHPYLYAVPTELSEFRVLLSELGVKLTFDALDYVHVLQCLEHDLKGRPLSCEQLSFVQRVLEAFSDCFADKQAPDELLNSLWIPDSFGVLMHVPNLVYNDAPWMKGNSLTTKHFVHPTITDDLAKRLGVQSLRSSSLVDEEMMTDLPCMDYARICELLALYGDNDFILFDLLELADYSKARKLHLIYDKREHPRQSLLQHNLGDFQGSALTVVLEGAALSREEICGLQLPPPWKIQGKSLNYGLGLISSFFICDFLTIISGGYFYMFDPLGLALPAPSSSGPSAKVFSLKGNDLIERFRDQFSPLLINGEVSLSTSRCTIIRMPLSSKCMKELETGCKRVKQIFDRFMHQGSSTLLFLKSVLQVSLSTWEEGNLHPSLDYSVSIDPSFAIMRNPFSEKKWRKFNLSRLFSSTSAGTKMHLIDIHVTQGGRIRIDKWLIVLCLGSGQTRNMALDRRYLAYNLTPVAGVAALISQNGQPMSVHTSSCILSPLPLSGNISMPVTALGCFLVCHNGGRYLFNNPYDVTGSELQTDATDQLTAAWNKELMLCIRDSYVEMILEFQKLKKDPLTSNIESSSARAASFILQAYGDRVYSFWPRSKHRLSSSDELDTDVHNSSSSKATEADWESLIEQVIRPFYARLVDLPVWQLYHGKFVKADEGMFLSQLGNEEGDNLPPAAVCSFIKEHYPVFSVPWELVREIQSVGIKVREIKPKMVRNLLKASSVSLRSIETYIDVLDYCLSDIHLQQSTIDASRGNTSLDAIGGMQVEDLHISTNVAPSSSNSNIPRSYNSATHTAASSGGDALELMTYFGKALYDFGRGVVDDIGRAGAPLDLNSTTAGSNIYADHALPPMAVELKGIPFPTATKCIARLGTNELWIGNKDQQSLMHPLADNFIHSQCLEKKVLAECLSNYTVHRFLKVKFFSLHLLSSHLRFLFSKGWVNNVMGSSETPWFTWENNLDSTSNGPIPEWIRLFWKIFRELGGELLLVSDWPLIPAFLNGPVLCRVKVHHLIFLPPITDPALLNGVSNLSSEGIEIQSEVNKLYLTSFESTKSRYPWLLCLLNQFNIPVYDGSFLDCGAHSYFCPAPGQSLGQVIASKLLAAKRTGYFSEPANLSNEDRERFFNLFASDFRSSNGCVYTREEVDVLRELPIYKTVTGTYTRLFGSDQCIISSTAFFHPNDELCISSSTNGSPFLHALGIGELNDQEVFVKFALPAFERKTSGEQEDILLYLYMNWKDLQLDSTVLSILKETNFVRSANELCTELFKPGNLLDPCDSLLASVFSGERNKFPGERFTTDGWLCILRKTGLRTSSQADMIIECAMKVEMLGTEATADPEDSDDFEAEFTSTQKELSFELWSLAGSLVDSVFTNFAVLYDNNFCEKLGKIAFIPAEKGFPSIGGKKGGKRILCSYSEAILLKDWPLAWSSAPILAKQNVVPPEYSWGAFHLKSPPGFSLVLKHLQVVGRDNGEDTLTHWPTSSGIMTVEDAFFEILKYLDKIWGTLSSSDIVELQKVAVVPVANGTRMVTAKSLFVRLMINLSPFAFELPSLYLPFVKILKEIGMQNVLSASYAKDLLVTIQKSCGYQRLNPNELRAVMEILNFICDERTQAISDELDWLSDAVVPDDGCRLVLARSCVYVDSNGSRFLGNIDTSRLRFAHPEIPEDIGMALGIKKLSDIVVEELYEEPELQIIGQIGSVPLDRITNKLLSKSLQDAVWILLNSITNHFPSFEGLTLSSIQSLLVHVAERLQFVQCLHTRFLLLPNYVDITSLINSSAVPEWEDSMRHRSIHFVDKLRNRILVADPPSYMSVYDAVAIVVSQVLEAPAVLPIGPLFSCPDGSEKAFLIVLKIGSESGIMKREGRSDILVGKELFPQDALQVQFLPLRPFYKGEIVALKTGKDGEKLRYGKVLEDVRPSAGQALYRFPVETEPGVTQVLLSTQIFSFRNVSMSNVVPVPSLSECGEDKSERRMLNGQSSKDARNRKITPQVAKELQYGKVSTTELVQAVHDMLSTAGINIDTEKQTLLQTTLTLQEQLKETQVALLVEQEKAEEAAKEADAAKAAWSCRVCLNAEVEIAMVPCGHILCRRCSSAVSRCPFCRITVSRIMKIFRP